MKDRILSLGEYQTLLDQAPILIWRADLSAGCDYFNERWLAFTGRTLRQELGNGWTEGVHPDDFDRCVQTYETAFAKREVFEMEYRLRRFDGAFRWLFDRGVPFFDESGVFCGFIGSCIDVQDRREAREALRAAQQRETDRLRQLLPICSNCRKVRDDHGYWSAIEQYMRETQDVKFTHGLCPQCIEKLYPELNEPDEGI